MSESVILSMFILTTLILYINSIIQRQKIDKLKNIIKEVKEYIKENTSSYYTNIEETNEEFELICDPEELLEILDKVGDEK